MLKNSKNKIKVGHRVKQLNYNRQLTLLNDLEIYNHNVFG